MSPNFEIKRLKNKNAGIYIKNFYNKNNHSNSIVGGKYSKQNVSLVLDDETKVLEWKPNVMKRLRNLMKQFKEENC